MKDKILLALLLFVAIIAIASLINLESNSHTIQRNIYGAAIQSLNQDTSNEVNFALNDNNNQLTSNSISSIDTESGGYLVSFSEDPYANTDTIEQLLRIATLEKIQLHTPYLLEHPLFMNLFLVSPKKPVDNVQTKNILDSLPIVTHVEENKVSKILVTTKQIANDPLFSQQWALQSFPGVLIAAAWTLTYGNPTTAIAVIDTGVHWSHPDLAANIWMNAGEIPSNNIDDDNNGFIDDVRGYDFVETAIPCPVGEDCLIEDNDPDDFHGHGTHVAGIAAAVRNNNIGISGACPQCRIMAIRAGFGGGLEYDDIIQSVDYATNNGAKIISMSFGGGPYSQLLDTQLSLAYSNGIVLIAAAGNNGWRPSIFPANLPQVLSIAASDSTGSKSWFSNFGGSVDLTAPGEDIISTVPPTDPSAMCSIPANNCYNIYSGTSMATPLVSGIAGLILSRTPSLSPDQVYSILRTGVRTLPFSQLQRDYIGTGIADASVAVSYVSGPITFIDPAIDDIVATNFLPIRITVAGPSFSAPQSTYTVSLGQGVYPTQTTPIYTGSTTVLNGIIANLDTRSFPDGMYTLKLRARDSTGVITQDMSFFRIGNTRLLSPLDAEIYHLGSTIPIRGSIMTSFSTSYVLDWGRGINPSSWSTTGITLTNVVGPTTDVDLGTWDTSQISTGSDWYTLRFLQPTTGTSTTYRYIRVYLSNIMMQGFPSRNIVGATTTTSGPGAMYPLIADLDGNSRKEIYIVKQNNNIVEGIDDTGSNIPSFLPTLGSPTNAASSSTLSFPIAADIDNDAKEELITKMTYVDTNNNGIIRVYAFNEDGSSVVGWPVDIAITASAMLTESTDMGLFAADLDNNSNKEIGVQYSGGFSLLSGSGQSLWSTIFIPSPPANPVAICTTKEGQSPAIGNFDTDSQLEIVVIHRDALCGDPAAGYSSWIRIYDLNGVQINSWQVGSFIDHAPAVADINNDGVDDIVVSTIADLRVYDAVGNLLPGWPQVHLGGITSAPAIADIDQNNDFEIIAYASKLKIFNHDGTPFLNWQFSGGAVAPFAIVSMPSLTNLALLAVTGATAFDVEAMTIAGIGGIELLDNTGSVVSQFLTPASLSGVAVSDLNNDSQYEVISVSNNLNYFDSYDGNYRINPYYYVNTYSLGQVPLRPWPTYHHDMQRTGRV